MRDWLNISRREPLALTEADHRRPLAVILREVAEEFCVSVPALRGLRRSVKLTVARKEFYRRAMSERDDMSSSEIARAINRDGSTVRLAIRKMEMAA